MRSGETESWRAPQPGTFKRKRKRKSPAWAIALIVFGSVLMVGASGTFAAIKTLGNRYESAVKRADLLPGAARQGGEPEPPKVDGPLTFLIIGSDSREGDNANGETADGSPAAVHGQRSDTVMLVHIPKSMDHAYMISIPRDSYVRIADKQGKPAGKNKINSAFAFGGAPRLVQTVNNLTGGRIDYPVIVDFAAVHKLTDLVGGVDVVVDKTSYDPYRFVPANGKYVTTPCRDTHHKRQNCLTFKAGNLHLNGQLAEYYVRQREGLRGGDLDRAKRQQQYMRALMDKIAGTGMITNPLKFDQLVRTGAGAVTVDRSMPIQSLAVSLKGLRPANLTFMTLPIGSSGKVPNAGSVLYIDQVKSRALFTALNNDTLDQYVLKYPPNDVSHGV